MLEIFTVKQRSKRRTSSLDDAEYWLLEAEDEAVDEAWVDEALASGLGCSSLIFSMSFSNSAALLLWDGASSLRRSFLLVDFVIPPVAGLGDTDPVALEIVAGFPGAKKKKKNIRMIFWKISI